MKSKNFEIHIDDMLDFSEKLEEYSLENRITGADQDDDIIHITVFYKREEKENVEELIAHVSDYDIDDDEDFEDDDDNNE